jgi:hypothetical protein
MNAPREELAQELKQSIAPTRAAAFGPGRGVTVLGWPRVRLAFPTVSREAGWVWLAVGIFIAMSVWWLAENAQVPDWDSGYQELVVNTVFGQLSNGHLTAPFTDFNNYPPLVYLVGALPALVLGFHPMAVVLASNLVFVPLLAFGCFGVGRIAYGPLAGVLAAIVALGSPMFVSMMHGFELDPPEAAMVAVSLWALLASRRFERIGIAAAAGLLGGLSLMTKETSVIFLAGPLVVVILRGGWRNRLGLTVFLLAFAVVAGPWYVYHWHALHGLASSFTARPTGKASAAYSSFQQPSRFTFRNLTWYGWDLINQQVLLLVVLLFVIGTALTVVHVVRRRVSATSVEPELLAGALVSYAGITYVTYKDPRYSLPILVYVAVLATGWITQIAQRHVRRGLALGVVALAAIYFVGVSTGTGTDVRIRLHGAEDNLILRRQLTLYETEGYVHGAPQSDADVPGLMDSLRHTGIRALRLFVGPDPVDFNPAGLAVLAAAHGLSVGPARVPAHEQAYLAWGSRTSGIPPCRSLDGGAGIYVVRAPAPGLDFEILRGPPGRRYTFICPGKPSLSEP